MTDTIRKPPQNVIVPQKKVEKWDKQIDRIDSDVLCISENQALEIDSRAVNKALLLDYGKKIDSLVNWSFFRDVLIILMLVGLCFYVGYRSYRFDSMQIACEGPQG